MRLTTKGRYAVTAMLDLALPFGSRASALSDISNRQNIPYRTLKSCFLSFVRRRW